MAEFHKLFCMVHAARLGLPETAVCVQYAMYFGFVDDIMFSHNNSQCARIKYNACIGEFAM